MPTLGVTVSRTALALPVLSLTTSPYWIDEDGLESPEMTWRRTYAGDSPYTHGSELVAAVKEQTSLPLGVLILADSALELQTALDDLDEAVSQFTYTTTVTVDGIARSWSCDPASWRRGRIDSGEQAAFLARVALTIPVYPIPGV